jgi:hypothetical protein
MTNDRTTTRVLDYAGLGITLSAGGAVGELVLDDAGDLEGT